MILLKKKLDDGENSPVALVEPTSLVPNIIITITSL
jgi:hypothetical protein